MDDRQQYFVRFVHNGRVHEMLSFGHDTAIMVFEALADKGYRPELWKGTALLRPSI